MLTLTPAEGPNEGVPVQAVFRLERDKLVVCVAAPGRDWPADFTAESGSGQTLYHLRALQSRND